MSDEAQFIAAMAAAPDDDAPRLVFADWLDEHGRPERAEFIRLECGPDRAAPAVQRADELLATHLSEWDAPFRAIGAEVRFRRGFPYVLEANLRRLVADLSLLALAPEWHLALSRGEGDHDEPLVEEFACLGGSPWADRIRGLNFARGRFGPAEVAAALTPAVVRAVRELRFGDDDHKREALDLVVGRPGLRLDVLGFGGDCYPGVGDDGCRVLAGAAQLASLRDLRLPNNEIGPDGVAALAASPHLRGLTDLDLTCGPGALNRVGPDGARHLAGSGNFARLESLDLEFNGIGDDGLIALAGSPRLPALRALNLPGNDIADDGLRALARSPHLPALAWLNVCASPLAAARVTAAGVRALAAAPRTARLTGLKLAGNSIGDAGAAALADAPAAGGLRELFVRNCGIGRAGFVRMLESPHLAGVREFALTENALTADEVWELRARYGERVR